MRSPSRCLILCPLCVPSVHPNSWLKILTPPTSNVHQCRRTTTAPVFGGAPTLLLNLPNLSADGTTGYYVYATPRKVVGVGVLPFTGNPRGVMGLVAHPGKISGVAVSHCGRFMFTAGGSDLSGESSLCHYKSVNETKCMLFPLYIFVPILSFSELVLNPI